MNHLTSIRRAFTQLQKAYDVVQKEGRKAEAIQLVQSAEQYVAMAKHVLTSEEGK